ncbi:MAG: hypothetical protein ACXWNK_17710 [Vulcanimicrobiaceae bacterium]
MIHRVPLSMHDQTVTVDAQRDGQCIFQGREILIELAEQPEMVAQIAEIYGSFGR